MPRSAAAPAVANARMYSANPAIAADWKALLGRVIADADLPWDLIDHAPPAPLAALWAREDLGIAMMCGLPFSRAAGEFVAVAAPIPALPRYGGRPVYFTDIVVRADARARTLEDTFGGVLGFTLADSLSGGVALAAHLQPHRRPDGAHLYREVVGGLVHPRGVIEALLAGKIDVGPLDSYWHDLVRAREPELAARLRTVASTPARPIPPLVTRASLPADVLARLRAGLSTATAAPELRPLMDRLLLAGFAIPDPADYQPLAALAATTPALEDL